MPGRSPRPGDVPLLTALAISAAEGSPGKGLRAVAIGGALLLHAAAVGPLFLAKPAAPPEPERIELEMATPLQENPATPLPEIPAQEMAEAPREATSTIEPPPNASAVMPPPDMVQAVPPPETLQPPPPEAVQPPPPEAVQPPPDQVQMAELPPDPVAPPPEPLPLEAAPDPLQAEIPPPPPAPPAVPPPPRVVAQQPPRPAPPRPVARQAAPPAEAAPGPVTAPSAGPTVSQEAPAPRPAAPSAATVGYASRIAAALERYKVYPYAARARRAQGLAVIRVIIARDGRVVSWSLLRSTGDSDLDEAVATTVQRASPLPAPPDELAGERVTLDIPVRFSMR
jgi:protein TonB